MTPPVNQPNAAPAPTAVAHPGTGRFAATGAMATLGLSILLAALGTSIANIALPALGRNFHAGLRDVQWVVTAYLAALTVSAVIAGGLGDRFGLKRMHVLGLALFAIASALAGVAPSLPFLVAARALQGIGAAFLMTLTIAIMRETAGEARMGRAMGLIGTLSALGTAIGPSLGGALLTVGTWSGVFLAPVPFAVLALVLALTTLPPDTPKAPASKARLRTAIGIGSLAPHLFVNLLVAAVMMTTLVVGPFYLGLRLGLAEALIGLVMSAGPVIATLTGVPSGRAVDRWGADRVLGLGLVMLMAGALALAFLPNRWDVAGYVAALAVLTPGYQLFQAANNTAVMADVARERRGVVSGLLTLSRNIGLVLGASLMGAVFAAGVGRDAIDQAAPDAIAGGMRTVFLFAAALMGVALMVVLSRASERVRHP